MEKIDYSDLWKKMTLVEYQRSRPDYLNSEFPRHVARWAKFSKQSQEQMIKHERFRLEEQGWIEQEDGSWIKSC